MGDYKYTPCRLTFSLVGEGEPRFIRMDVPLSEEDIALLKSDNCSIAVSAMNKAIIEMCEGLTSKRRLDDTSH